MQELRDQSAGEWLPLPEAARCLGLSVDTVRRRAKRGRVQARQVERPQGHVWEVWVAEAPAGRVIRLAGHVGNSQVEPAGHVAGSQVGATQVPARQPASSIPDDQMLVPRAAWQTALEQIGNLHQLAEHLANASARAAKAETAEEFLRERNAELRAELDATRARVRELEAPVVVAAVPAAEPPAKRAWWRWW